MTQALALSVDFLNVSFPEGNPDAILREICAFLGIRSGERRSSGMHGYDNSVDLGGCGIVAFGGATQRGTVLVSLNGQGTGRIARFGALREWIERLRGVITRVDLAGDDFDGKLLSVGRARSALARGLFNGQGRKPEGRFISDLGSKKGSSLYVGARTSGKMLRVYDKGKQLGEPASTWVRAEVELRNKDRVIPLDVLTDPARFFAGAYRWLSRFSVVVERIRTFKKSAEITLAALTAWAKVACGRTVNVLLHELQGDLGGVVELLRRDGVPGRLRAFRDSGGAAWCPT